jgi:hypothetical protein
VTEPAAPALLVFGGGWLGRAAGLEATRATLDRADGLS